ncbi:unnamed protein product [Paramecium sonneborni]|uniref:Uncharacterized protein n=1 Tax=Paramecium sonneborni TaxID=65129 RepID=A0A8S1KNG9_9CILI|nr:unnamed protein product [Paramecium sonneborni]
MLYLFINSKILLLKRLIIKIQWYKQQSRNGWNLKQQQKNKNYVGLQKSIINLTIQKTILEKILV